MPPDEPQERTGEVELYDNEMVQRRREIRDKFWSVASEIQISKDDWVELSRRTEKIGSTIFSILTPERDWDFDRILNQINELLGMSNGMEDSYILFENSTPEFRKHYNLIFDLHEALKKHRRSWFYMHWRQQNMHLYPTLIIEEYIRELQMLLSRLKGHLKVGGDYILDSLYLGGTREDDSSDRIYNNGRSVTNPNWHNRGIGAPEQSREEPQRRERDLGM